MAHVVLTAIHQRFWDADINDAPRFIRGRTPVWFMDGLGGTISGPYICLEARKRKLFDPVSREVVYASHDSIPFTQSSVIDNALEVHDRHGRRKMVEKDREKGD